MKPMTAREIVRALLLTGWRRGEGDERCFLLTGPQERRVTVPDLGSRPLPRELADRILAHAGLRS